MVFRYSTVKALLLPTAAVIATAVLRAALNPVMGLGSPLLVFTLPVIVSSLYVGAAAGLLATCLSAVVGTLLFIEPVWSLRVSTTSDAARVGVFVIQGVFISWLVARVETEHRRAVAARIAAEEANRAKNAFLAVLSHELRTPLNVILGHARMLRGTSADRVAAIIERNAVLQTRLVEDLLDVQRIERHELLLEHATFDLAAVVASIVESLHAQSTGKGLQVTTVCPRLLMEGDPARIQQVVWNLLSNAVKFTPPGGACFVRCAERESTVELRVENTGEAIPERFLPKIFNAFEQLDMTSTRRHSGVGLGLWIVKNLVELHGGTVTVQSGDSTVFTVTLPRRPGWRTTAEECGDTAPG